MRAEPFRARLAARFAVARLPFAARFAFAAGLEPLAARAFALAALGAALAAIVPAAARLVAVTALAAAVVAALAAMRLEAFAAWFALRAAEAFEPVRFAARALALGAGFEAFAARFAARLAVTRFPVAARPVFAGFEALAAFGGVGAVIAAPARLARALFALGIATGAEIALPAKALLRAVTFGAVAEALAGGAVTALAALGAVAKGFAGGAVTAIGALAAFGAVAKARLAGGAVTLATRGAGGFILALAGQKPLAQLVAQRPAAHFHHVARGHVIQPERAVADADQPVHRQPDLGHGAANFTVLAFADAHGQPGIRALLAVDGDFHRLEIFAVNGDAGAQRVKALLGRAAVHPHAIFAQPAGFGQLEAALQPAVIGQQQQAFRIQVKPAHVQHARHAFGHFVENRAPALIVLFGRHQPERFVIEPQPGFLRRVDRLAVDGDLVARRDIQRGAVDGFAIHRHAAGQNQLFSVAARGIAGPRDDLGDALGGGALGFRGVGIGAGGVGHVRGPSLGGGARSSRAKAAPYTFHARLESGLIGPALRAMKGHELHVIHGSGAG